MDSVGSCRLKEASVKSEAVADAKKNPHFTKMLIYWRQWTLGVVK